ncbi:DnaD domain-containing protein [Staphylococcus warneri]|jgi:DNA replication protein|uniref:DnaD domain protein n=1 Tax=Staphylococcus warneri TaxID=1292 RepID=A0A2T4Q398_STAWA|nr:MULTISPECIES: DnaD domain-containing protein [Staphylococcus]MBE9428479.1 DnaD domain-containing protein [Staphylococcus epidermidis]MBY6180571.1 DnaD domain-containing protein [Staphylococcaceae bacterium DP2N0-1]AXV42375.1 DNA replication protein, DnaD [Staphylococcus sp. M0911]EEQ80045.1 DnaD domain protein [Staphylococcus warneri L37603]MBO0377478.1 DnaD domain-containing protein [Staphylococcus warneri]
MDKFQLKTRPVVIRRELLDHYSELGLDEQDLIILIKLIYASETSNKQPSIELLQKGSNMQPREVTAVIQNLIQRELLELNVNKDEEGRFTEYMNLDPFYEKLSQLLKKETMTTNVQSDKEKFKTLFQMIEQTFARPLSPYEIETLNQWIDVDQHDIDIIQAALDEANSQNKLSFKYMDRILLNWKKNNVKTIDDSKEIRKQFNQPKMKHTVKKVPKFDWLNGEKSDDK